ncbi:hypothetical protein EIP86_000316 [Pleurotus ostreatoroseus]|nr:hypothetical protein EIP86_000316 [Pleurotus ostreatoroseus]
MFTTLMQDAGLDLPEPEHSRRAPTVLKLAQRHYRQRMKEIEELLAKEEAQFRKLVGEIDLIRAGKWDEQIHANLVGEPLPPQHEDEPHTELPEPENLKVPSPTATSDEPHQDSSQIVEHMLADQPTVSASAEATEPPPSETPEKDDVEAELAVEELPPTELSQEKSPSPSPEDKVTEEPVKETTRPLSPQAMEEVEEEPPVDTSGPPPEQETAMDVDTAPAPDEEELPAEDTKDVPSTEEHDVEMTPTPPTRAGPSNEGKLRLSVAHQRYLPHCTGKRKTSEALSEPPRERKRLREESEQLDEEEPGPSTKGRRKAQGGDKKFQNVIGMLHSSISQHRYGNIFHNPIKKSEAADYADLVKRPMDLKTIKARVKDGVISNSLEFQRDVYLMFANAMMYNRPGSEIFAMAEEMMLESEIQINNFRQTEGFHHK